MGNNSDLNEKLQNSLLGSGESPKKSLRPKTLRDFFRGLFLNGQYHISGSRHRRDIYFTPIDAEYTILYTNLRGCIALSGLEKKLFK